MLTYEDKIKTAVQTLYDHFDKSAKVIEKLPGREIKNMLAPVVGGGFADSIFLYFFREQFIAQIAAGCDDNEGQFKFTEAFFRAADKVLAEQNVNSVSDSQESDIPAADRIVSQNHNSAPYNQAVDAVDAVIEAVRKDNEYGARDDEDRDQRIAELKAGAELLKSNRVEVSKIEAVLIKTLAYLTGIGVAVSECAAAIKALKALFGLQCMALPI